MRSRNFILDVFVTVRFYVAAGITIACFILAYFIPVLFEYVKILSAVFFLLSLIDGLLLFFAASKFTASRISGEKMSNADENNIQIRVSNPYKFDVHIKLIDELPEQLQERNFEMETHLPARAKKTLSYKLRPTERGEYEFGAILIYVRSGIGLIIRRFTVDAEKNIPVYPSFLQLRNHQLLSSATIADPGGNRRVRRIGQSMEFEQIKDYVAGDDMRNINWRATARRGSMMTNHYVDEKSQQVYCIVDKGRLMKMPFAGLSLLDYAINSILALQNACLHKQDKVGLVSFSTSIDTMIAAERKAGQSQKIMEALYKENTLYKESDFEMLYMQLRYRLKQRSLLLLYTNFETLHALKRQLPYLRSLAKFHLLVVIFFNNTELTTITETKVADLGDVYIKTIAEKYMHEKKLIVKELRNNGILSLLSTPQQLTVNSINKYLEIKSKRLF